MKLPSPRCRPIFSRDIFLPDGVSGLRFQFRKGAMLRLGSHTSGTYQSLCELQVHYIPQLQLSMSLPLLLDDQVERSQYPSLAPSRSPSCESIATSSTCDGSVPVKPVRTYRWDKPIYIIFCTSGWAITPLDNNDREREMHLRELINELTFREMLFMQGGDMKLAQKQQRLREKQEGRLAELIRHRHEVHRVRAWRARALEKSFFPEERKRREEERKRREEKRKRWEEERKRRQNERKREEKERKRQEKERKREEKERKREEKEKRRQEREAAPSRWRRVLGAVGRLLTCCKQRKEERHEGEQQEEAGQQQ